MDCLSFDGSNTTPTLLGLIGTKCSNKDQASRLGFDSWVRLVDPYLPSIMATTNPYLWEQEEVTPSSSKSIIKIPQELKKVLIMLQVYTTRPGLQPVRTTHATPSFFERRLAGSEDDLSTSRREVA